MKTEPQESTLDAMLAALRHDWQLIFAGCVDDLADRKEIEAMKILKRTYCWRHGISLETFDEWKIGDAK